MDSSIVNYTISQSTGTYHRERYVPSSDSSTRYWTHRYITATKTITGWNKIIATLTNYDFDSTRWYNMIWVYVKVINDGLAWYPGPYPNHGTWNYWRSCWICIGRLGNQGYWESTITTTSITVSELGYATAYACDARCDRSEWAAGKPATITVTFSK